MSMLLHRPVCDLLGCRYPLVLAGMGGVARAELVAAVSHAGGFGFLGMVREPVERIRTEIEAVRQAGIERFGVNLIPAATDPTLLEAQIETLIALAVPVVGLFWDVPASLIRRFRAAGLLVVCQVGSVEEARAAQLAGASALIAQGVEAGGHVRGDLPLYALLGELVPAVTLPVLAAGGLADGADVATVLALGAQGAVFGTALIATSESFAHDVHKRRLVAATAADTLLTEAFHINWPPGARTRVLANSVTRGEHGDPFADTRTVIGEDDGRPIYLFSTDSPLRSTDGDFEAMALYAGTGVDRVGTITGAAERVERIVAEAEALLAVDASPSATSGRMSSAPCFAAEVGTQGEFNQSLQHVLTGDADRDSERTAGGRTRWRTHRAAHGRGCTRRPPTTGARHPARRGALVCLARPGDQHLGGMPSRRTGDFYAKAMAIDELPARFAFLNHGQRWVVRRLQALLPQVRDPHLQAKLQAMGAAHEDNIKRLAALLDA